MSLSSNVTTRLIPCDLKGSQGINQSVALRARPVSVSGRAISQRAHAKNQLLQRIWYTELQTNLPCGGILDLGMTGHRGGFVVCDVVVNGVLAALAQ